MNVEVVHDELRQRAFLHDDPEAYMAGVNDALAVLAGDLIALWESERSLGA